MKIQSPVPVSGMPVILQTIVKDIFWLKKVRNESQQNADVSEVVLERIDSLLNVLIFTFWDEAYLLTDFNASQKLKLKFDEAGNAFVHFC